MRNVQQASIGDPKISLHTTETLEYLSIRRFRLHLTRTNRRSTIPSPGSFVACENEQRAKPMRQEREKGACATLHGVVDTARYRMLYNSCSSHIWETNDFCEIRSSTRLHGSRTSRHHSFTNRMLLWCGTRAYPTTKRKVI